MSADKMLHSYSSLNNRSLGSGKPNNSKRRGKKRGRRKKSGGTDIFKIILLILIVLGIFIAGWKLISIIKGRFANNQPELETSISEQAEENALPVDTETHSIISAEEIIAEAEHYQNQYDCEKALDILTKANDENPLTEFENKIADVQKMKSSMVRQDINQIPHIFFHTLVVEPENCFDSSKWGKQAGGYNSLMTTISEFERMIEELYQKGYVLVGLHDMGRIEKQADGTEKFVEGDIMLPPDKKAIVMSQDDVCYYEYMEGAGFAIRMVIGEDGRPTTLYRDPSGNEVTGDYDLVPILDKFIDEHPDFSYRGAKACLAFTGYNGILGYRTDETYDPDSPMYDPKKTANNNIKADRETARQVAKALVDDGYELASHSWGHRDMGAISFEHMKKDTDRWDRNVNQELLGGLCDIIIYPKGADVADWHPYTHDNEKFDYLWKKGFRYFCNVDSSKVWVQAGKDYLRQGRRPLDGLALWNDIANGKNRLSDFFDDPKAIFDSKRPTPVPPYA